MHKIYFETQLSSWLYFGWANASARPHDGVPSSLLRSTSPQTEDSRRRITSLQTDYY